MENIFERECSFSMKWIISRQKFEGIKNKSYCQSDTFKAPLPGVTDSLRLYADGEGDPEKGETYVYFELHKGMMESIQCDFTLSFKLTPFTLTLNRNFEKVTSTWGGRMASKKQFSNPAYFLGDNLALEVEGTMKGKGLKFDEKHSSSLIQMMLERSDKDITIFCENEEIKAHKDILISRSSVFKEILKNEENTIKFDEFSLHVVQNVIDFCYDIDIKNQITLFNASKFFHFSDKFEMEDLKNTVEISLIKQISDENVSQLATASIEFNAKQLRECCISFLLLKKPDEISSIKDWDKIDKKICQEIIHRVLNYVTKISFDVGECNCKNCSK